MALSYFSWRMTEVGNWSWLLSLRSEYAVKDLNPCRLASLTLDRNLASAIFQGMKTSVPFFLFGKQIGDYYRGVVQVERKNTNRAMKKGS
jgi:hypothetical protein